MKPHKLDKAIPLLDAVGLGVIHSDGEYLVTDYQDPSAAFESVSELDREALDALHARLMALHRERAKPLSEARARRAEAFSKHHAWWADEANTNARNSGMYLDQ